MRISQLNLSLYLSGKINVSIDNKNYYSQGDLIGFELMAKDINQLYQLTELDQYDHLTSRRFNLTSNRTEKVSQLYLTGSPIWFLN
ncbi:hypothetical protein A0256_13935 [Mucilaginibacter sp. PAMC 26640]|nr:hypothetical protein A0256_13935 [Mucilaginibacter sp. PAMC 26640]